VAALLAATVGAYAALGGPGPPAPAKPRHGLRAPVRVTGHVTDLVPGSTAHLRARARNRSRAPIRLLWVKARASAAGPACGRLRLRTTRVRPRVEIAPGATRRLRIPVRLRGGAPDACQGAVFPLRYRTRVARARQGG
jgi:hypothetical protein